MRGAATSRPVGPRPSSTAPGHVNRKRLLMPEDRPSASGGERLTEQALRDGEARLRAILETAVDAIITIDERDPIESFNPAAERLFD
jgi:PAS domain-containing protein